MPSSTERGRFIRSAEQSIWFEVRRVPPQGKRLPAIGSLFLFRSQRFALPFPSNLVPRTSNLPLERRAHRQPKRLPRPTQLVRRPIQLERFLVAEPPGVRVGEQAAE